MDSELRHLIIPVKKEGDSYRAILSDDSLDRDGEFMSPDLIKEWAAGEGVPMLANHQNAMQSFIGGWTERQVVENDGHVGLSMKPNFFSADANPLAQQIKNQIEEAEKMGIEVGVSIGFIPKEGKATPNGYMHTVAELVEASVVPVQSNRNAVVYSAKSFGFLADRYRIGQTVKKGEAVIGHGGDMAEPETKEPKKEDPLVELAAKVAKNESDLAAQAAKMLEFESTLTSAKAELAEAKKARDEEAKKRDAQEKEISDALAKYKDELEGVKGAVAKPKGRIPGAMLNPAGIGKETQGAEKKEEKFNATDAFLKQMAGQ